MLLEKDMNKLLKRLSPNVVLHLNMDEGELDLSVIEDGSKISLTTPVYFGGNYIPMSVRKCVKKQPSFYKNHFPASLKIDEDHFLITLNYISNLKGISTVEFLDLLQEFFQLADEWRSHLDDHDKNDLVHVRVGK